jgi:hypothetical protein
LDAVLRIAELPRHVTQDEFQAALEADLEEQGVAQYRFDAMGPAAYAQLPQPVVVPFFDALRLDEDGWLWARLYELGRWPPPADTVPSSWVVFDPEGRARGTVEFPAGLEVHWIGSEAVLGVRRTALDVELVEGYRFLRPGG